MGVSKGLLSTALLALLSGCVLPEKFTLPTGISAAPTVFQIGAAWNNKVLFVPDPTRGGALTPALTGRIYLFGEMPNYPFIGDGALVVTLHDDTVRPNEPPVPGGKQVEEWRFDPATLKRLAKKDAIGDGYTILLPMGSYEPGMLKVHIMTRYEPAHGMPVYAALNPLALDHGSPPPGFAK